MVLNAYSLLWHLSYFDKAFIVSIYLFLKLYNIRHFQPRLAKEYLLRYKKFGNLMNVSVVCIENLFVYLKNFVF